jgi:uncharacterized membrane protein
METYPFLIIILSAFFHATWNLLAKKAEDKRAFMWIMVTTSIFSLIPIYVIILPEIKFPFSVLPYLLVSAIAEALYFFFLSRAYELGDLSVVYPLARFSPLFLTIVAVVFLNEKITAWGFLGIILMIIGVYTIHLKSYSIKDLFIPLHSLREQAPQYAILTALCTTAYSISDKIGVTKIDPITYSFWLEIFIFPFLTAVILLRNDRSIIYQEWKKSKVNASIGGFLMRFGYILILIAMSQIQVSYILALRQISVVIGAIAGVLLLKEGYGRTRIVSSIILFLGAYILAVLA